ncbi:threonine aldolase family protein [Martelella alba]|uniref:Low specificity L-threonine aldolase n=1 Tax=Martelella alba TaxID=2590451 RepID=A0ABY2SJ06_9HYPH|nr:GntG family PLP-dependent aldolase [Martelella alba]TKI05238.1 low specificity L-threonine aldolase [Martelella alba]
MIDLRSDTVTTPTDDMWRAMRDATLGDDTLEGDATVAELETRGAELTGKPAALFVTSGTMGNVIAALAHNQRGGLEAIVDEQSHMALSEAGGLSCLAGLFCVALPSRRGEMDLTRLAARLRGGYSRYGGATGLVCVETSHNHSGGWALSLDYLSEVRALSQAAGVPVHMDGARACNAAVALGVGLTDIAGYADSMTFCLSKGLSAPMGSLLTGDTAFIQRARTFRRMLGGGLRQAGIMAAAGLVALRQGIERLADDHRTARLIWQGLRDLDAGLVEETPPQTNILQVAVCPAAPDNTARWVDGLSRRGVLCRAARPGVLRLVTHRLVAETQIPEIVAAFRALPPTLT